MSLDDINLLQLRKRQGEKWRHYGDEVLPAWVADMDFEIAEPIKLAIAQRVADGDCGYPMDANQTGLPEILAHRLQDRFSWSVAPNQIDLFNDVVQAIYFGLLSLADEDDGVLIQTPIYPPFMGSTKATQRRMVLSPLVYGANGFEIDFDTMERQIDKGTKILLLCNPHNPSGRCFSSDELERLGELALRHKLWIISDEIHADLVYSPFRHIPIASISREVAARTVTLMSASKAFNIAGICMAFAIFGSDEIKQKFDRLPRHLRGGVSALSIAAVSAALAQAQPWLDEVLAYLQSNRDHLAMHAAKHWPSVAHVAPQATYLSWFDFKDSGVSGNPYRYFLKNAKVALGDGARFGGEGQTCARINFATSRTILNEILGRLDEAIAAAS